MFIPSKQKSLAYRMFLFHEVIKQGSFTKAAEMLDMTKSGLSQHISALEKELDSQLLKRTTRKLVLTEKGHYLAEKSQQLYQLINTTFTELYGKDTETVGTLAITLPHAFQDIVFSAIKLLKNTYPNLKVIFSIDDNCIELLTYNIDIAIRVGMLNDSGLKAKRIGHIHSIFVAAPEFLDNKQPIEKIDDLIQYDFIASHWQQRKPHYDIEFDKKVWALHPAFKSSNLPGTCKLALNSMGYALLPSIFVKPYLEKGTLVHLLPKIKCEISPVYLLHPYTHQTPTVVKKAMDAIVSNVVF